MEYSDKTRVLLEKIFTGPVLQYNEAYELQTSILEGLVEENDLVKIFEAFERGLIEEELDALYDASKAKMISVVTGIDTIDTVGSGGDMKGTINISTIAAILLAAGGVQVTKHGNRSITSKCGTADVLQELGVNIELNPQSALECFKNAGIVFLFAQAFNPGFKNASSARKSYGKPTYFNILGPLLNPAHATFRLIGLAKTTYREEMGRLLIRDGVKKVWIVSSRDGLDEISPSAITDIYEFTADGKKIFAIDPTEFGFNLEPLSDIVGGDAKENAMILKDVLKGVGNNARINAALLNAGAGFVIAGAVGTLLEGIELARKTMNDGRAISKLQEFIACSNKNI